MVSGFDDLAVDAQVLRHRGRSGTVILTLLVARKPIMFTIAQ